MPRRVFVHVGLLKTGTSYVQSTLFRSQQRLAERGVAVPGEHHQFQRRAVWDLIGRRLGDDEPHVPGSWPALVDEIHAGGAPTTIVSEEFLVHARRRHVRRLVSDFAPAEVHVVITVREVTRVIGSMWQHEISQGAVWPWEEFVAAVRDPDTGPPTAGVGFWLRYDLRQVLALWEGSVPADRITVVIVPPEGAAPRVLLERFAEATGIDAEALTTPDTLLNTSVGVVETEMLRRLNQSLGGRLNERQYLRVSDSAVKPALRGRNSSTRLEMPAGVRGWLVDHSEELIEFLQTSSFRIVGDLDDLRPRTASFEGADPREVADADLFAAALAALTGTVDDYAGFWWRVRRRKEPAEVDARTRLVSSGRALAFKMRTRAFELADDNKRLAWVARAYLRRRTSRR